MRTPADGASATLENHRHFRHRRSAIIIAIAVIVVLLFSLRSLAVFYTDALWFYSVHLGQVWSTLLTVKLGLGVTFGAIFAILIWANLYVADRFMPWEALLGTPDELVRGYQSHVAPHRRWIRVVVALFVGALGGLAATGQWNNWLLFTNGGSFPNRDPLFHMNDGFFIFKLPFYSFIVDWLFVAIVMTILLAAVQHYLNGGIRFHGEKPRVSPAVKAHLSVLLAFLALVKAAGYVLLRYDLVLSTQGYVQGAGYTDIHARLPAIELLFWISLICCVALVANIWRKGWTLPVLSLGLWAFVALAIGVIYPALIEKLKVDPAQDVLERPYISRNIQATRAAMGLTKVKEVSYNAAQDLSPSVLTKDAATLSDATLWDPSLTASTFSKLQDIRSYYGLSGLATVAYNVSGKLTPVVIGARQVNSSALPAESWVNKHLQYTHGYGAVAAPSNMATGDGNPNFTVDNVPPTSATGWPKLSQPNIYYGVLNPSTSTSYVVVNTDQGEMDYQTSSGSEVESHYKGPGGVLLNSTFKKLAFAIRFGDLNLLVSNLLTPHSRIMFVRDIESRVEKAAPFLRLGSHPYAVIVNGGIDWVDNAYTVTDNYPYAENANTNTLPGGSGLQTTFNYVRNSVKVVTNAYTGKMTFYVTDPSDPIIQAYERAFPGMFTPESKMSPQLRGLLRYPEDLLTVQSAMYGRYHITQPEAFYNAGDAWSLSQAPGVGSPSSSLSTVTPVNAQGIPTGPSRVVRMSPQYEMFSIPGQGSPTFNLIDAYVPLSQGSTVQTLSAFMVAGSSPSDYGKLVAYVTPRGKSIDGPALVEAQISATPAISQAISLLDQHGSSVLLGNVLMFPIHNSIVYMRPLYVESSSNALPELRDVIVVYGKQAAMDTSLPLALSDIFQGVATSTTTSSSTGTSTAPATSGAPISSAVKSWISQADQAYQQAQADLKSGDLGGYQQEVNQMGTDLQNADAMVSTPAKPASSVKAPVSTTSGSKSSPAPKTSAVKAGASSSGGTGRSSSRPPPSSIDGA